MLVAIAWIWFGRSGTARSLATVGGLDPRRVAVLYFNDLSRDSSLGYLADGLTEALIDELGRVRALDVISRNGVAPYRGTDISRDSIARTLGVGTLVEGSVEDAGPRLRLSVRLVDGGSGADIRRQSYELPRSDLLALRDSAAHEVARFLRERLGEEVRLRERRAETKSVDAWALLQQAERLRKDGAALLRTEPPRASAAFQRADSLLAQAERLDPAWIAPVVLRAQIAQRWARALAARPKEMLPWVEVGLGHARRALGSSPGHPEAMEVIGTLRLYHYLYRLVPPQDAETSLRAARDDLQIVVQNAPSASAYAQLSLVYYQLRDVPAALIAARQAYEADAYLEAASQVLWRLFAGSYDTELFQQASEACDEGARRFPEDYRFVNCRLWLMVTEAQSPNVAEAWRLFAKADSLAPAGQRNFEHYRNLTFLGAAIGRAGLKDSAHAVLLASRQGWNAEFGQEIVGMEAFARTQLGDHDEAIALLKRYVAGNPEHLFRAGGDLHWWWRPLKDHPEFRVISARRQ
jgi:serine/threonine-protein kinase